MTATITSEFVLPFIMMSCLNDHCDNRQETVKLQMTAVYSGAS